MAVPGLQWVATPPAVTETPSEMTPRKTVTGEMTSGEIRVPPQAYTGPPSYPAPPRWGFPLLGWRRPMPLTTPVVSAAERM
ncbi:MAG: hypothetical protein ACRDRV_05720, partial [Pseudonocardiaceae bacterium]